jgi:hypothetical protein
MLPPHAVGSLAHCVKVCLLGSGGLPAPSSGTSFRRARGRDPRLPGDGDPEPRYRYGCAGNRPLPMSWLRSRDAGSDCQLPVGCVRPCLALDPPQVVPCAFLFAGVPGRLPRAATGARAGGAQRTEARGQGLGPVASVLEEAAGSRLRHSATSKRARLAGHLRAVMRGSRRIVRSARGNCCLRSCGGGRDRYRGWRHAPICRARA